MRKRAAQCMVLSLLLLGTSVGCFKREEIPATFTTNEVLDALAGGSVTVENRSLPLRRNNITSLRILEIVKTPLGSDSRVLLSFDCEQDGRKTHVEGTLPFEQHGPLWWFGTFQADHAK